MDRVPTLGEIAELPITLDVEMAGRLLGIGRTTAYRLVADGQFPCRVLPVGGQWRVPTADLLATLGLPLPVAPTVESSEAPVDPPGLTLVKDLT